MKNVFFYILWSFVLIFSCKKSIDTVPPNIQILEPITNQTFTNDDTLRVIGNITDNEIVKCVELSIVDKNEKPVRFLFSINPQVKSYQLKAEIPISEIKFIEGISEYYLKITAYDNNNMEYSYVSIQFIKAVEKLKYILTVCKVNGNNINLIKIDSTYNQTQLCSIFTDYKTSSYTETEKSILLAGNLNGNLYCVDLLDGSIKWSIKNDNIQGFPGYTTLCCQLNQIFAGHFDHKIKIFYQSGILQSIVNLNENNIPQKINVTNNAIQVYELSRDQNNHYLNNYFLVSGAYKQGISINYSINSIFNIEDNCSLLFCNKLDKSFINKYFNEYNTISQLRQLADGNIYSVCKKDDRKFIFSHSQGIFEYDYINNSLIKILSEPDITIVKYDELKGQCFFAKANKLLIYNEQNFSLYQTITQTDSITDFYLIYDK